jgi:hypothetical protein
LQQQRGLGEPADPSVGQLYRPLDVTLVECVDAQAVCADTEVEQLGTTDVGQSEPERLVDVDVGGAWVEATGVDPLGQQVEAGVDAVAGGERLETESVATGGDDRSRLASIADCPRSA